MAQEKNRFSALRVLREQRHNQEAEGDASASSYDDDEVSQREDGPSLAKDVVTANENTTLEQRTKGQQSINKELNRRPGRPPGRRSNPDYTQISAYIPLELLQEVQDELAEERRLLKQRTARPVSDLVEELLDQWLTNRKRRK